MTLHQTNTALPYQDAKFEAAIKGGGPVPRWLRPKQRTTSSLLSACQPLGHKPEHKEQGVQTLEASLRRHLRCGHGRRTRGKEQKKLSCKGIGKDTLQRKHPCANKDKFHKQSGDPRQTRTVWTSIGKGTSKRTKRGHGESQVPVRQHEKNIGTTFCACGDAATSVKKEKERSKLDLHSKKASRYIQALTQVEIGFEKTRGNLYGQSRATTTPREGQRPLSNGRHRRCQRGNPKRDREGQFHCVKMGLLICNGQGSASGENHGRVRPRVQIFHGTILHW